jgi:NarL family two-component system response regulator LiaR
MHRQLLSGVVSEGSSTVVLIDDQISYSDALSLALEITPGFEVLGRAPDGPSGIELCVDLQPDIVVCDYRLPGSDTGTSVAGVLRERGFGSPIMILTGFLAPQVVRESEGLVDVTAISKDTPIDGIVEALRAALEGREPPATDSHQESPDSNQLSKGEMEVLELLNQGHKPAEIAQELHLSLHTIRARIKSVHRRLDVTSQGEAIAKATRLGLLVPPR